ncbi:YadA-like family protein [Acinetobacter puyangensis]|uniref:YadA-like family protein n=1 Tax=Acinetobacter puyangensis TaxID=1096779 RepID=UPI003A4D8DAF
MKKTFQLSALAVALTATGSAFADLTVNGTTYPVAVNDVAVSIDGLPAGSSVLASINSTGVNVNAVTGVVTPTSPTVQGSTFNVDTIGTADSVVPISYTDTYSRSAQEGEISQIYTSEKISFSSKLTEGTEERTVNKTANANYDASGEFSGVDNVVSLNDTGYVFTGSTTLEEETIIVGKENSGDENALTIRKTDTSGTNETKVTASGISTGSINLDGADLATTLADETAARVQGDADTLATANSYTDTAVAAEATIRADANAALQVNIYAEEATRADEDAKIRTELAAGDAATLESAKVYTDDVVAVEAAAREAGDQAIRDDIATKVTTNELEINGPVTVNNVKSTTTVDQAGTPATTPTFGNDVDGDGKPDTLVQTKEQTDTVTVNSQTQEYNENNLTFSSTIQKGTQTTTDSYVADISYDENGLATYGTNVPTGQQITSDLDVVSEDTIIVGKEFDDSTTALTIRNKDADGNEAKSVLTAQALTTGNVTADTITLAGADLATTIADGDAATLASANTYTDSSVAAEVKARTDADTALQANIDAEATTRASEDAAIRTELAAGDAATLASANTYTDSSVAAEAKARTDADTALQANIDAEATTRASEDAAIRTELAAGDAATLASANTYTDSSVAAEAKARTDADIALQANIDVEATTRASEDAVIRTELAAGDAATLASANTHTDSAVTTEAKARTDADTALQANIDAEAVTREAADKANATAIAKEVADRQAAITTEATARETGDAQTLTDAKAFTASTATTTLNSAKSYTDTKATETLTAANAYTDTQVSRVSKKLDDVEKTAYRGVAIALAAQQQVPNIKPGQFAVFGGVGHYEGESAGALGVVSALADGRTSVSAALGVTGSGEVGGRVGVAYVFGGN